MSGIWERAPLRIKLVAALSLLVAAALGVAGFAGVHALRGYLVDRVDEQLSGFVASDADHDGTPGPGPGFGHGGSGGRGVGPSQLYINTLSASGALAASPIAVPYDNQTVRPDIPKLTAAQVTARNGHPFTVGSVSGSGQWRVVAIPSSAGGSEVVAESLNDVDRTVHRFAVFEWALGGGVLLLLIAIGYVLVRGSLRPLESVERTAEAIAAGDLTQRVPAGSPRTEVGRLSQALNGMLGQIETAFTAQASSEAAARDSEERMRRFVADASHELRTPLTSIRGFAELYRQGAVPDTATLTRVMRRIEDEAARMGLLVEDLLLLARLDEQRPLERLPVDVLTIARDAVTDASVIGPDHPTRLSVGTSMHAPVVVGDEARLRQVLGNLVTNALTHTPPGTSIIVSVDTRDDADARWVELAVADQGPGLPTDATGRVFERFYRADPSRTRGSGGTGLGLSIVAALVAAHGGTVDVDSDPGTGTTFTVRLPHIDSPIPTPPFSGQKTTETVES